MLASLFSDFLQPTGIVFIIRGKNKVVHFCKRRGGKERRLSPRSHHESGTDRAGLNLKEHLNLNNRKTYGILQKVKPSGRMCCSVKYSDQYVLEVSVSGWK